MYVLISVYFEHTYQLVLTNFQSNKSDKILPWVRSKENVLRNFLKPTIFCCSMLLENTTKCKKRNVQKRFNFPKKVDFVSKPQSVAQNQSDISMYICKVFYQILFLDFLFT